MSRGEIPEGNDDWTELAGAVEPAPATGEWTADDVTRIVNASGHDGMARAINAALAAKQEAIDTLYSQVEQLRKQLAAEQEKWEQRENRRDEQEAEYVGKMTKELTAQIADRKLLAGQLAAERGKVADAEILCRELQEQRDIAKQQLAAEKETAKQLCKIYFEIAAGAVGEEAVRIRRDAMIDTKIREGNHETNKQV